MTSESATTVPLGTFLFSRVHQLGISRILGVPGDFNMPLLDHIFNVEGLDWIGFCNELNAAYAADGYGRIRGLPGVVVTTYGVGELSAINGVSGAFAEHVPLLHIVGTPGRPHFANRTWLHHTLPGGANFEDPDLYVYSRMSAPVRCASAFLENVDNLAEEIDRVLIEVWRKSLPGYLFVPLDIVNAPVPVAKLDAEFNLKIVNSDPVLEDALAEEILDLVYKSARPAFLIDLLARRHRTRELVTEIINKTGFPSFTTEIAKGFVDEDNPAYVGRYNGKLSLPNVQEALESSDLVINIGPLLSDNNSGSFTRHIEDDQLVILHPAYVSVKGVRHDGVHFLPVLEKVVAKIDKTKLPVPRSVSSFKIGLPPSTVYNESASADGLSTTSFYKYISSNFLRPHDIVFAESGTAQYAIGDVKFPANVDFHTQLYYSSIGFALPAALGASVAQREIETAKAGPAARIVLFEGDGSSQMTIQDLTTVTRNGYNPIIFLINNSGYTIERAIHGPYAKYNDISPNWKWTELFSTFGADQSRYFIATVRTQHELASLLDSKEFNAAEGKARFVEVVMDRLDIPWRLTAQVELIADQTKALYTDYANKKGEAPRDF
ncbi:thiamine diphosphate-binding protein [Lipomyces japonicus]|uniref:thiamine diphosphate-binding protein n=1 Tax=Lipomyces japonicus TaxID=56871 RepID=UPI0034CD7599